MLIISSNKINLIMSSKILLSIAIPTYNRAAFLKNLLDNIVSQVSEVRDKVEICISNNGSTDNTREVVMNFKKKYPDLIKYNENEENLGFDKNLLKVMNMAGGKFVWTFSDDDLIVKDGIKRVIKLIEKNKDKKVGGMAVKDSSYVFDFKAGKKIKYHSSVDENKPQTYGGAGLVKILQGDVPYRFISALLFNNKLLKKILGEKPDLVKRGIGSYYFHSWIYLLMFLLNKDAEYRVLNEDIVTTPDAVPKYKFIMEDHFELIYKGNFKFFDNLLSIASGADKYIKDTIKKKKKRSILDIILAMALFKAFGVYNYISCARCIKLSFKYFPFFNAIFISVSLILVSIIPSPIIKKLYKIYLKFRLKEKAESAWLETYTQFTYWNQSDSNRRITK